MNSGLLYHVLARFGLRTDATNRLVALCSATLAWNTEKEE